MWLCHEAMGSLCATHHFIGRRVIKNSFSNEQHRIISTKIYDVSVLFSQLLITPRTRHGSTARPRDKSDNIVILE